MLTLKKEKKELYQWDFGVKLTVDLLCDVVHFSNVLFGEAMTVIVKDNEVEIPNILLTKTDSFYCWAFAYENDGGYTTAQKKFDIRPRPKPAGYVYTPTEVKTIETVISNALKEAKDSGDFDGKDGETPYIKDGYWYIGNTNTNTRAEAKDGYTPQKGIDYVDGKDGKTPFFKVFQTSKAGVIRCETNMSYNFYCTDDSQVTLRAYGSTNEDSSGKPKEISGKYLTVFCGDQYETFTDGNGNTLSGSSTAKWYASSMTKGTITPIGSMTVKRGVLKHPDGGHYVDISYPAECSIIITENAEVPNANGVSF